MQYQDCVTPFTNFNSSGRKVASHHSDQSAIPMIPPPVPISSFIQDSSLVAMDSMDEGKRERFVIKSEFDYNEERCRNSTPFLSDTNIRINWNLWCWVRRGAPRDKMQRIAASGTATTCSGVYPSSVSQPRCPSLVFPVCTGSNHPFPSSAPRRAAPLKASSPLSPPSIHRHDDHRRQQGPDTEAPDTPPSPSRDAGPGAGDDNPERGTPPL